VFSLIREYSLRSPEQKTEEGERDVEEPRLSTKSETRAKLCPASLFSRTWLIRQFREQETPKEPANNDQ
jgi:hypothetical protein